MRGGDGRGSDAENNFVKVTGLITAAATVALLVSGAHAAELLQNGGFEGGVYTDAGGNPYAPVGWTTESSFDFGGGDVNEVINGNAHSGAYALEFGNYDAQAASAIDQSFADVVGATYSGSFWVYATRGGDPSANVTAQINGVILSSVDDSVTSYMQETFSFIGTGHDTLTLTASTNPGEWMVDDVSIMGAAPVMGAPEPASWALMLIGAGAMGLGLRKRRGFTLASERA